MLTILYCAAVLIGFLAILDESMRILYWIRAKRAGSAAMPLIRMSRPFGLPNLKRMILAAQDDMSVESGLSIYGITKRKTFLMQFSFDMEFHTKDSENIKAMLATQFKDFDLGMREQSLGYFLGRGIFTLSGQGWKHSRSMLRPQFSRQLVAQLSSVDRHVAILIDHVKSGNGRYNFQDLFHKLTMDTATEFLFGESTATLEDSAIVRNGVSAAEFVTEYKQCLGYALVRFMLGPLYWMYTPKAFRDGISTCRKYVDYFVQKALDETEKSHTEVQYTFSYELAKVTRDPIVIRDQLLNILIAGHDTTANLLGYTLWYLGHYPEIWTKLREAVFGQYPDKSSEITFENIKRCTYLSWVLNEVLRLNPIVPRNLRFAIRDTFLPRGGGPDESQPIFVPKGTCVSYHTFGLQRDPELWGPDANEFKPERWENPNVPAWAYIPFSGGPRICIGQQFALTEASVTLIRLVQNFEAFDLDNPHLREPKNHAELGSQVSGGVWGSAISS